LGVIVENDRPLSCDIEQRLIDGKVKCLPKVPNDDDLFGVRHAVKIILEWEEAGTFPWMRRRTVNLLVPRLALLLCVVVLAVHLWWALSTGCSYHFARAGALVALIAAIGIGTVAWHEPKGGLLNGGLVNRWAFFHPMFMLPLLGVFGTVIWGYGDLLRLAPPASCCRS